MNDIVLRWRGDEYRIPEAKAFEAGAALEEVVTLADLQGYGTRPKFFTIARAMATLLRFAGCKVSDIEVKREIDASIRRAAAEGVDQAEAEDIFAVSAVNQLVAVLFDGAPDAEDDTPPGETSAS